MQVSVKLTENEMAVRSFEFYGTLMSCGTKRDSLQLLREHPYQGSEEYN